MKAQNDSIPWEDIHGERHEKKAEKPGTPSWIVKHSTPDCILPQSADAVKFYITNTLNKLNRVPIWQFFVHVEQLHIYHENLPGLPNQLCHLRVPIM